jgi:hypothetical protein
MFLGSAFAYAGDYTDSAHGNSDTGVSGRLSGYGTGNCAHCHEQHASVGGNEPAPDSPAGPDEYLLFQDYQNNTYNSYCTDVCHDGTADRGDDIATQYSKDNTHPTTGVHTPGESTSAAFGVRHGYCIDCHNPHVAKKIVRTVGSNSVSGGPLLKVSGVSVTNSTAWTNPTYTFIPDSTGITEEYQLCFKCHSSWPTPSPPTGADNAKQFNPANASFHPVELNLGHASSGSSALADAQLKAEWQPAGSKTMYCSDCHGEDAAVTPPAGPHGSPRANILKGYWPKNASEVLYNLANLDDDCLCKNCHPIDTGGWKNGVHDENSHRSDSGANILCDCVQCHVGLPHGYHYTTDGAIMEGRFIAHANDSAPYNYGGNTATITRFEQNASAPGTYSINDCAATCYGSHD